MRLAIFQMNSVDRSVAENAALFDQACADAKSGNADLIIFPEMALTGYNIGADRIRKLAEPRDGPMIQTLRDMAKHHRIGVLCGFPELDGEQVFNAAVIIDADRLSAFNLPQGAFVRGRGPRGVQSGGYPVPACAVWRLVGGVCDLL